MQKISRFVFNFRDTCNMMCPFCYIPFVDSCCGNIELWKKIIDKLAIYSPDIITFGGGEPFAHNGFIELLSYCQNFNFQVHVDTNGISIPTVLLPDLKKMVTLIGLPIDGSLELHDHLRKYDGHYRLVCQKLNLLAKFQVPVRINTLFFPDDKKQIIDIAKRIQLYPNIRQWFIYEYWHFKGINPEHLTEKKTNIASDELDILRNVSGVQTVHYSSVSERSPSYIFISSIGNIYSIAENSTEYLELGNILRPEADTILSSLTNIDRINKRAELKHYSESMN